MRRYFHINKNRKFIEPDDDFGVFNQKNQLRDISIFDRWEEKRA